MWTSLATLAHRKWKSPEQAEQHKTGPFLLHFVHKLVRGLGFFFTTLLTSWSAIDAFFLSDFSQISKRNHSSLKWQSTTWINLQQVDACVRQLWYNHQVSKASNYKNCNIIPAKQISGQNKYNTTYSYSNRYVHWKTLDAWTK